MKKITVLILLCYSITGFSQYIADPSFEDTLECPSPGAINLKHWYTPTNSSPDSYCSCFTPNDFFNLPPLQSKSALDGDCFIGLGLFTNSQSDYREYVETKLIQSLKKNVKYCISLNLVRCTQCNFAISNISIGFRSDSTLQLTSSIMNVDTFYKFSNSIVIDTINWQKLKLSFIATGEEKFLSIGNHDELENVLFLNEEAFPDPLYIYNAYYYIDMITLEECPPEPVEHFLVYPNPSSGGSLYLSNYADTVATVTLFNGLGQRVAERMLPAGANGLVAFEGLASGVYIAVYQTATGYREEKKVVVL